MARTTNNNDPINGPDATWWLEGGACPSLQRAQRASTPDMVPTHQSVVTGRCRGPTLQIGIHSLGFYTVLPAPAATNRASRSVERAFTRDSDSDDSLRRPLGFGPVRSPLPFSWSRNGTSGLRARHDLVPLSIMVEKVVSPGLGGIGRPLIRGMTAHSVPG
jgi:hypothetical protein